ncbi:MAG TPA: YdcF family protein [Actinomycetota bacterium]|nr:YdcF family protein [Actinomycetota bacterium]
MRTLRRAFIVVLLALVAYPLWLGFRVWDQSHNDEVYYADAIVVLGAAQYNGRPSPVYKARLDHAAYLYTEGIADTVIVSGGKARGDRYTEAEAGQMYLEDTDVPSQAILAEKKGRTTLESLKGVRRIAAEHGIETGVFVSDPLHSERIKRMALDVGFDSAYTSPANYTQLERSRATKAKEIVHEVLSLLAYEFLRK